jgi:ribosomal protein L11 methyltransferase
MQEDKQWLALEVRTAAEAVEAVEFALGEMDALGTYYGLPAKPDSEAVTVSGYFLDRLPDSLVSEKIGEALNIYGFDPASVSGIIWKTVENRDWLAEWKEHWEPTFTDRFVVAPPWKDVDAEGRAVIVIEPGMAFGTGTHETTRLCLREIENHFVPGMSVLDVGTGTGILAIAAAIVSGGKSRIAACDVDDEAVAIAVDNARINDVAGIEFSTGSIGEETASADLVCANLTAGVIMPILPLLVEKTDRILILSGILVEQEEKVTAELARLGCPAPTIRTDGEWVSITVEKVP